MQSAAQMGKIGGRLYHWFDRNILELGREFRLSYLPPLLVYFAAGTIAITGIVGSFFVKKYLSLTPEALAALGFWVGIPWALKMPMGHLVDLIWRYKSLLVYLGAAFMAFSLLIMIGLLTEPDWMTSMMSANKWYMLSSIIAPVGFVLQDVVADAMTVEAVPNTDESGNPIAASTKRLMHTTMQTLGRVAIISGGLVVAIYNLYVFDGVALTEAQKIEVYAHIYKLALFVPLISILGVALAGMLRLKNFQALRKQGVATAEAWHKVHGEVERPPINWWILGGSLAYAIFVVLMGTAEIPYNQEIIFLGSMSIVLFLMFRLFKELDPEAQMVLFGTALVIFIFRALPSPGAGVSWWMMDELKFDEHFFSILSLIASSLTLLGMFLFRRLMAERSILFIVFFLTIAHALLSLPGIGMYYGLHNWTSAITGGVVDARFIALIDTALVSPLGQISMIPMLAWIANSAPKHLKATFFAVMASFTNLALSASALGTKYVNQVFEVKRQVVDPKTQAVVTQADYSELGVLLISVSVIGLALPIITILIVKYSRLRSA